MFRIARHFTCLALAATYPLACAAAQPARASDPDGWGIVTSQPITVAGHEFCRSFMAAWLDKPGSDRYTIAIRERPSARWGTQVWVEYGPRRVLQVQLPPARTALKALGENAAESAYQAILDVERQRTLILDADLAPDEF
ncbi:curli production assembly/transport component CsgE [Massilia sp. PDC64]|nr:CsgE family curli-type amyloid fiber assembly protein [Massilia sp. PDC64]SDF70149.1 curli production assembly/transport component CsgE [Massilia sp. PDC64]